MNDDNRTLTAYCGLYCGDCIPSNKRLFQLVNELDNLLSSIGFQNYAEFKCARSDVFENYDSFINVLCEIKKLECSPQCYEGPNSQLGCGRSCIIRKCVLDRGLNGCWDCSEHRACSKLIEHKEFHPGLEDNLESINKYGINDWISHRGKHYKW